MAWQEPIIISDAVYTNVRCGTIRHDKSLTVNCLVKFMTYWHKFQMSCVDRYNLLCCEAVHCSATKQAGALTPPLHVLCGIGIAARAVAITTISQYYAIDEHKQRNATIAIFACFLISCIKMYALLVSHFMHVKITKSRSRKVWKVSPGYFICH